MSDELEALLEQALADMLGTDDAKVSTSSLGRLVRLGTLMARTGSAVAGDRLRRLAGTEEELASLLRAKAAGRLASGLGEMKGLAMKVGQMMSYADHSLPPEYRKLLALLQTQSQPTPIDQVRALLEAELQMAVDDAFAELDPAPIACASIGQVHRGRLHDGTRVAVKVQHPGVEQAIRADLKSAAVVGRLKGLVLTQQDMKGMMREIEARFLEECDYLLEAERQQRFAGLFAEDPEIVVPEVHGALCRKRVLVTTFYEGASFQQFLAADPPQPERDRIGDALYRFYLATLYRHALFHADPHPGNYLFTRDGRLVMLDYGCVKEFSRELLERLRKLMVAVVVDDDEQAIHRALVDLGIVTEQRRYDRHHARTVFRYLYAPAFIEGKHRITHEYASRALTELANTRNAFQLTMPADLLFLNRVNFGLMSIFAELGAELDWRAKTLEILDA